MGNLMLSEENAVEFIRLLLFLQPQKNHRRFALWLRYNPDITCYSLRSKLLAIFEGGNTGETALN
jgi:hypothetical protein